MSSRVCLHKRPKSCQKNYETLLFESYSKKKTFGVIILFSPSFLLILYFFKFCHMTVVVGHYIYQSRVLEMTPFEM